MKFRADPPVRIALTSGHTAIVDSEWRELPPVFHSEALASCECDQERTKAEHVELKSSDEAKGRPNTHDDVIRQAIELMIAREGEPEFENDFTADNLPNTKIVSSLGGMTFRKEDVLRVYRAMQDEAAALEAAAGNPTDTTEG